MHGLRAPLLGGLMVAAFILVGCPGQSPKIGPPPTPRAEEAAPAVEDTSEPPAPTLPDPRAELPPIGTIASPPATTPAPEPASIQARPSDPLDAEVYSVQVFASTAEERATEIARQVGGVTTQPVETAYEDDGLWHVYVGRANGRESIDALRDQFRTGGYEQAWTKHRVVRNTARDATLSAGQVVYSVQVFASSSMENANRVAAEVRQRTSLPVDVVRVGEYVKVFVGRSPTRESIDAERDRLRQMGYPDAWTYQRQGL